MILLSVISPYAVLIAEGLDTGSWIAIGTAIGALIGAGAKALIDLANSKAERQARQRKDSLQEWQDFSNRLTAENEHLKEQNERRDSVIDQLREAIQAIIEDHAECRAEAAEHRQAIVFLNDHVKRLHAICIRLGAEDVGPLPEMPTLRQRTESDAESRAVFTIRQAKQSMELLKKADEAIAKDPARPGNSSGSGSSSGTKSPQPPQTPAS